MVLFEFYTMTDDCGVSRDATDDLNSCHPSIRESARSFEVERLAATTLKLDAETNPEGLAKWHVYFLRSAHAPAATRCRAHADHDTAMRSRTFSSPDYIGAAVFYGELPTPHDLGVMLEDFKASKEAFAWGCGHCPV